MCVCARFGGGGLTFGDFVGDDGLAAHSAVVPGQVRVDQLDQAHSIPATPTRSQIQKYYGIQGKSQSFFKDESCSNMSCG